MAVWIRQGMGLDVALAVALEVGKLRIESAGTSADHAAAAEFNARLWRTIRRLAATAPDLADRDALLRSAEAVEAAADDADALADRNATHAGALAGRAATQGALKGLLAAWSAHRDAHRDARFATWLLERIEAEGAPLSLAA